MLGQIGGHDRPSAGRFHDMPVATPRSSLSTSPKPPDKAGSNRRSGPLGFAGSRPREASYSCKDQWAWRNTALGESTMFSYQTVNNEPSASCTVDG